MQALSKNAQDAVGRLIRGESREAVAAQLAKAHNLPPEQAERATAMAVEHIARVASFDRVAELGASKRRLESIYREASDAHDWPVALSASKELNRLLGLQTADPAAPTGDDPDAGDHRETLEQIAKHITRVSGLPEDAPLLDHARVLADKARRMEAKQ